MHDDKQGYRDIEQDEPLQSIIQKQQETRFNRLRTPLLF